MAEGPDWNRLRESYRRIENQMTTEQLEYWKKLWPGIPKYYAESEPVYYVGVASFVRANALGFAAKIVEALRSMRRKAGDELEEWSRP